MSLPAPPTAGDRATRGRDLDVVVVGAGQAGLAAAYYLRRTALAWTMLDARQGPGGAWRGTWPSLRLFSPAAWSSLPGWPMRGGPDEYPTRGRVLEYLAAYERRYDFPVERPVTVHAVRADGERLALETSAGVRHARAVVSATGTSAAPFVPAVPGADRFAGTHVHSANYAGPDALAGRRVVVVGAGNSGAQIVAELAGVAAVTWATREPPTFLPDDVDGRVLFAQATERWNAMREGRPVPPERSLGDIVVVPTVREARDRGALAARPMFVAITERGVVWPGGVEEAVDAIVWATGFRAALDHLAPLGVVGAGGRIAVRGTRAIGEPRLWLVGYGDWTGFASATLIGVGRTARATVDEIVAALGAPTA